MSPIVPLPDVGQQQGQMAQALAGVYQGAIKPALETIESPVGIGLTGLAVYKPQIAANIAKAYMPVGALFAGQELGRIDPSKQSTQEIARHVSSAFMQGMASAGGMKALVAEPKVMPLGGAIQEIGFQQAEPRPMPPKVEEMPVQAPEPAPEPVEAEKPPVTPPAKETIPTGDLEAGKVASDSHVQHNEMMEKKKEFDPPSLPTLQNARSAPDLIIKKGERHISGGSQEGTIVDVAARQREFDKIGYERQELALPEDFNAVVSETYGPSISNVKSVDSAPWLGAHFNGGIAIKSSLKGSERGRVLAHEKGHASHSLLGDEINKNEAVLNEMPKIEQMLYPGLREKVQSAENPNSKFFNYLLSPDELIAEFNVERLNNPKKAESIAPELSRLLESVEGRKDLVADRKSFPTWFNVAAETKSRLKVKDLESRYVPQKTKDILSPAYYLKSVKSSLQKGYKANSGAAAKIAIEKYGVSPNRVKKIIEDYADDETYNFIKKYYSEVLKEE